MIVVADTGPIIALAKLDCIDLLGVFGADRDAHTAQRIKDEIQAEREEGKSAPEDFLAFAREKVKGYKRRGQIGIFRSYRTTCLKFTAFIEETYGREEVPFGALEAELFREFRTYCYEERGNSTNTVGRELGIMRTLYVTRSTYNVERWPSGLKTCGCGRRHEN